MKTITLTLNEALVLIAEGMTMNNVKTLANKLRNADAPTPAIHPSNDAYNDALKQVEILKQNLKSSNQQVYDYERALEKAKQTETKLRDDILKLSEACAHVNQENYEQTERANRMESKIRDLENDAKQDDESLKYFRKWVEELRVATGYGEGVTPATVFSNTIELVRQHMELCKRVDDRESKLAKANDVIAAVKLLCDHRGYDMQLHDIKNNVENYYRGN